MDEVRQVRQQAQRSAAAQGPPSSPTTDLRGFDLDYSNSATLVLSAKLPVAPAKATPAAEFDYFVYCGGQGLM